MRLPRALYDELIEHALSEAPLECCGLIACMFESPVECYRCANACESEVRYELEGMEQMRIMARIKRLGLTLGAIYHSHTHADPVPSQMDIASAAHPELVYVIVGVGDRDFPGVRAWRIVDGEVSEEALVVS